MTHGILSVYIAVAGVSGGWALGYMAAEGIRAQGWRVWVVEMSLAISFAAFAILAEQLMTANDKLNATGVSRVAVEAHVGRGKD